MLSLLFSFQVCLFFATNLAIFFRLRVTCSALKAPPKSLSQRVVMSLSNNDFWAVAYAKGCLANFPAHTGNRQNWFPVVQWWYPNYETINTGRRDASQWGEWWSNGDHIKDLFLRLHHQTSRQETKKKRKVQSTSRGLDWRWKLSRNQRSPVTHYTLVGCLNPHSPQ